MSSPDNLPSSSVVHLRKRRRWPVWAAEAVIVVLVLLAIQGWQSRDVPVGRAPEFAAPMADGRSASLDDWRAEHPGETVAVYFWATWCPICKLQEGSVDALRADWPVLTVAMQSGNASAVATFLRERGRDWPAAIDADGRIAARYGLHGVPAMVVVDGRGEIRSVMVGYTTGLGMRLRLWWATATG